jgi:hypothetical protein
MSVSLAYSFFSVMPKPSAVEEARRLGLGDERICEYLRTEWISDHDLRRLAAAVNVGCASLKSEEKDR